MFGIAMLTIVRSSKVMKNPSDTTASTAQGLPRSLVIRPTINPLTKPIQDISHNVPRASAAYSLPVPRGRPPNPPWQPGGSMRVVATTTPKARGTTAAWDRDGARGGGGGGGPRRDCMLPVMELNGTAAIVSGGASGLGAATARVLAAAGATVVVADLNEEGGKQVAGEIGGLFARTDVTDEESVQEAVEVAAAAAPLRAAVSCAGIGWAERTVNRDGSPHSLAHFARVIAVNLTGTFNMMRIAASAIAKTEPADADGQRGVVINTSSVAGLEGQTGQLAYSASKGGIIGMTVP